MIHILEHTVVKVHYKIGKVLAYLTLFKMTTVLGKKSE
jgi:hypothetical protein